MPNRESTTTLTPEQLSDRARVERVIDRYLKECYSKRTAARASEISNRLNANRSYFSEVATRLFGKTLKSVLREKQLAHALRLLEVTALSVREIGAASGFGDKTTFHRTFKRAFGIKPAQYRRKKRASRK
jgi:AraC-like DNA-binding protein